MTNPEEPSTPSGSSGNSKTKATDHELQKYDNITRYGQRAAAAAQDCSEKADYRMASRTWKSRQDCLEIEVGPADSANKKAAGGNPAAAGFLRKLRNIKCQPR